MYSYIRFDTQYAVWISCRTNVAPKSNLIELGSAHEWSGVWTGPEWSIEEINGRQAEITEISGNILFFFFCHDMKTNWGYLFSK